jgi:hypothetical protein
MKRSGAQERPRGECGARGGDDTEEDGGGGQGGEQEAAPKREGLVVGDLRPQHGTAGNPGQPHQGDAPPTGAPGGRGGVATPATAVPQREADGQRGADQERLSPRVRAVVDAVDVGGRVQGAHLDSGSQGTRHTDDQERPAVLEEGQDPEHDEWPEQIELLFDGQGPHVDQRWGGPRLVEVVRAIGDEVPVGVVEERREAVRAQRGVRARRDQDRIEHGHAEHHHQQAGEQSPGPPGPERTEAYPGRPLPFGDEERRDEIAGEGEERIEGVEAARRQEHPAVEAHDDDDGNAPDPVEGGNVGEAGPSLPGGRVTCPRPGRHRVAGNRRGAQGQNLPAVTAGEGPVRRRME